MRRYLTAAEVAELAELLEDAPVRAGVIDQVLQAADRRRGMTLFLQSPPRPRTGRSEGGCGVGKRRLRDAES